MAKIIESRQMCLYSWSFDMWRNDLEGSCSLVTNDSKTSLIR